VIRLRAEKKQNWGSVSGGGADVSLSQEVPISPGAHPVCYKASTEALFRGGITLTVHLHLVTKVKKDGNCAFTRRPRLIVNSSANPLGKGSHGRRVKLTWN
jgi:hypothetical protein